MKNKSIGMFKDFFRLCNDNFVELTFTLHFSFPYPIHNHFSIRNRKKLVFKTGFEECYINPLSTDISLVIHFYLVVTNLEIPRLAILFPTQQFCANSVCATEYIKQRLCDYQTHWATHHSVAFMANTPLLDKEKTHYEVCS